jgi:hypothetical protein
MLSRSSIEITDMLGQLTDMLGQLTFQFESILRALNADKTARHSRTHHDTCWNKNIS